MSICIYHNVDFQRPLVKQTLISLALKLPIIFQLWVVYIVSYVTVTFILSELHIVINSSESKELLFDCGILLIVQGVIKGHGQEKSQLSPFKTCLTVRLSSPSFHGPWTRCLHTPLTHYPPIDWWTPHSQLPIPHSS